MLVFSSDFWCILYALKARPPLGCRCAWTLPGGLKQPFGPPANYIWGQSGPIALRERWALCSCTHHFTFSYFYLYSQIKVIRLVGMMLAVFIQERHYPFISELMAEQVGTGIMGKMVSICETLDCNNLTLFFKIQCTFKNNFALQLKVVTLFWARSNTFCFLF